MNKDLRELVKQALDTQGLNGLHNFDGIGCACHVDDLMPCDEPQASCVPSRLQRVTDCGEEECEWKGDAHYHLAPEEPCAHNCPGGKHVCGLCHDEAAANGKPQGGLS